MSKINEVYIGGNYTSLPENSDEFLLFCCKFSNKIALEANIKNIKMTNEELEKKIIYDIMHYYREEDINRRNRYLTDLEYKNQLHEIYPSEVEIKSYFDRLYQYDLVEVEEIKKQIEMKKLQQGKQINQYQLTEQFKNELIEAKFTPISLSCMGSIYKNFLFKLNKNVVNYLQEINNIFLYINIGDYKLLENPVFYLNERIIAVITTHERYAVLFLTDEELEDFNKLNIPYVI